MSDTNQAVTSSSDDASVPADRSLRALVARSRALRGAIGGLAGAALGLGYYFVIGCSTGGCPITSNPVISALYGALIGVFAASSR